MRTIFWSVAAVALACAAGAEARYPVRGLEVINAAAQVTVIPEDRADVSVDIRAVDGLPTPAARVLGDRVLIDGGLGGRIRGCRTTTLGPGVMIIGRGYVRQSELPTIVVRTPKTLALNFGMGVSANIGPSAGGKVVSRGCGMTVLGDANGPLEVALDGSGDIRAERVVGFLRARLDGSGDIDVRQASTGADLGLDGSGDIRVASVAGPLNAAVAGSGDIAVATLEGPSANLSVDGSGDLVVRAGRADKVTAAIDGSGNLTFGGRAGAVSVSLDGSGDLRIAAADRIDGQSKRGSGDITIGR